jgi:hypothetical protein
MATWLSITGRSVTIDDVPCPVSEWTDGEITCVAPVGVGAVRGVCVLPGYLPSNVLK